MIDVGDVPGHQLRVAQHHIKYGADAPEYAGVKVLEYKNTLSSVRSSGFSDMKTATSGSVSEGEYWFEK
jgi:hypothetical protein